MGGCSGRKLAETTKPALGQSSPDRAAAMTSRHEAAGLSRSGAPGANGLRNALSLYTPEAAHICCPESVEQHSGRRADTRQLPAASGIGGARVAPRICALTPKAANLSSFCADRARQNPKLVSLPLRIIDGTEFLFLCCLSPAGTASAMVAVRFAHRGYHHHDHHHPRCTPTQSPLLSAAAGPSSNTICNVVQIVSLNGWVSVAMFQIGPNSADA